MSHLLLFSDVPLVLPALANCLTSSPEIATIEIAESIATMLACAKARSPDVVVMDFIPSLHFNAVRDLNRIAPGAKLVLWTRDISVEAAYEAVQLGARGILPKSVAAASFRTAVEDVIRGQMCLDSQLSATLLTLKPTRLTPRESQIVMLLSQGLKNKEIATALDITEGSVKVYLSRLFLKLGMKDRYELALFGLKLTGMSQKPEASAPPLHPAREANRPVLMSRFAS